MNAVKAPTAAPAPQEGKAPPPPAEGKPAGRERQYRPEGYKCELCPDLPPFPTPMAKGNHVHSAHPDPAKVGPDAQSNEEASVIANPPVPTNVAPPSITIRQRVELLLSWLNTMPTADHAEIEAQKKALRWVLEAEE